MAAPQVCFVFVVSFLISFYVEDAGSPGVAPSVPLQDGGSMPGLALGTWLGNTSQGRIKPQEHEVYDAVLWAIEAGYRHVDTASVYGVEDQVGRAVNDAVSRGLVKREDFFITTKLWSDAHAQSTVIPDLRQSLARLNLTYVDLYLIQWPVGIYPNLTFNPVDYVETWRGMIEAQRAGLTKHIGVSNFNASQIQRLVDQGLDTPAVLQVELNLNLQQPSLLSYCAQHHIAVTAYSPFGSLLPTKARPGAPPPRIDDTRLAEIAQKYNKTVPQVVLRYLVELGATPLPKSLTKSRIQQNIQLFDFQLADEDRQLLRNFDVGYRGVDECCRPCCRHRSGKALRYVYSMVAESLPQLKWKDHTYFPFADVLGDKRYA